MRLTAPGATLNSAAGANMARLNGLLRGVPAARLLNLGSGTRFLGADRLDPALRGRMVNLDLSACRGVHVVADAHALPFAAAAFDGIVCQAVLEHTRRPADVVGEMRRVLRPAGLVYAEVPFLQGYHPSPRDYHRFTPEGLAELFAGFERLDAGVAAGPSSSLSWMLRDYLAGLLTWFTPGSRWRTPAVVAAAWMTFPLKYLDVLLSRRPGAAAMASGLYFLGRRAA